MQFNKIGWSLLMVMGLTLMWSAQALAMPQSDVEARAATQNQEEKLEEAGVLVHKGMQGESRQAIGKTRNKYKKKRNRNARKQQRAQKRSKRKFLRRGKKNRNRRNQSRCDFNRDDDRGYDRDNDRDRNPPVDRYQARR